VRVAAWLWLAPVALLIAAGSVVATSQETPAADFSKIAPLAPRSLLLDGVRAGERMVVVGERGHVLLSDDRGASWRQVVVPTRATLTAVHFPSPERGFAVGHDSVILATSDGGETWTLQFSNPELESPLLDVWFADVQRGFAVGAYGLFMVTQDGGQSWETRLISESDVHHNAIAATEGGRIFVAGERGTLFRSDDDGQTWQPLSPPQPASLFGAIALPGDGLLVFGLQGRAHRTYDGGETWETLETDSEASLMGGVVTEGGRLVLGGIIGVVLTGRAEDDRLTLMQRPDRKAVATAAVTSDGQMLLIGAFGVEEASSWLREGDAARGGAGR